MNRFEEIKSFIPRVESEFADQIEDTCNKSYSNRLNRIRKWNEENRKYLNECIKKYSQTEKGKVASIRRSCTRRKRHMEACKNLSPQELSEIKEFYLKRPEGYEVDHIIPISRGGSHHISNLQYLTRRENQIKGYKLPGELAEYKKKGE